MYGRDPDLPQEILELGHAPPYGTMDDYRAELDARLEICHKMANEAIPKASETQSAAG